MDAKLEVNSFLERILNETVPRHFLDISSGDTKENTNNIDLQNSTYKNAGQHYEGLGNNNFTEIRGSSLDTFDDLINNCLDSVAFGVNKSLSPNILSKCLQMGHGYQNQGYLKRNMLIPVGDMPFMCSICGLEFENRIQITDHIAIHKGDKLVYMDDDYFESINNSFSNNTAFNIFNNTNYGVTSTIDIIPLDSHKKSPVNKTKRAANTADIKVNECSECGKKVSSSYALKRHKLLHAPEKPFICEVCGKGFVEKSKLKRHLYTHAGIRPFECSTCGSTFTEKSRLTQHMTTHSELKNFRCSECGKHFCAGYNLKRHLKIHADKKV